MKFDNPPSNHREEESSREAFRRAERDLELAESSSANWREHISDVMDANKGDGSRWDVVIRKELLNGDAAAVDNVISAKSRRDALLKRAHEEALIENESQSTESVEPKTSSSGTRTEKENFDEGWDRIWGDKKIKDTPKPAEQATGNWQDEAIKNYKGKILDAELVPLPSKPVEQATANWQDEAVKNYKGKILDAELVPVPSAPVGKNERLVTGDRWGAESAPVAEINKKDIDSAPSSEQVDRINGRKIADQAKVGQIRDSITSLDAKKKESEGVAIGLNARSEVEIKGERLLGMLKRLSEMGPKGVPLDPKDAEEYAKLDAETRALNSEYGALRREKENIAGNRDRSMQQAFERMQQKYRNEVIEKFQKQHEHTERHEQTMETIRKQMNSRPYYLQPEQWGVFGFLARGVNWLTKKLTTIEEAQKEKAEKERWSKLTKDQRWDETMKRMDDNDKKYAREIMGKSDEELDQLVSVYNKRQGDGVTGTQVSAIHEEIANRKERVAVTNKKTGGQEAPLKKYDIPLDRGLLVKYGKDNFGFLQVADAEQLKKIWEKKGYAEHFSQYTEALVRTLISTKTKGLKYADTVASVFTNGGQDVEILKKLITTKTGKEPSYDELLGMPFSKVAKEYLDLDIEKIDKGYFEHFRRRE